MDSKNGTIIVTGAAGGIGGGFVSEFLKAPHSTAYYCIYIVHPSAPGNLAATLSKAPKGHAYEILPLDLSLHASIRVAVDSINERISSGSIPRIRGLLLVAGGIFNSPNTEDGLDFSEEGIEMTFTINYLANFLLTILFLKSMDDCARIIFMSSTTHNPAFKSNALAVTKEEHKILLNGDVEIYAKGIQEVVEKGNQFPAAMRRYGTSKLCMNMFMYELQRRLDLSPKFSKISIMAMDPGAVAGTDLYETFPTWLYIILRYVLVPIQALVVFFSPNGPLRTPARVGKDLIFACWDEKVLGETPKAVYLDGKIVSGSSPESHDEVKQKALWRETVEILRLTHDASVPSLLE